MQFMNCLMRIDKMRIRIDNPKRLHEIFDLFNVNKLMITGYVENGIDGVYLVIESINKVKS